MLVNSSYELFPIKQGNGKKLLSMKYVEPFIKMSTFGRFDAKIQKKPRNLGCF